MVQRVGRGIAPLFHDRGTGKGWVVSSTPRPHFTPGKDPVPILQKAGWDPGPVWTGEKSRPHRDSIPDRPTRSQSLYRLRYPAHKIIIYITYIWPPLWSSGQSFWLQIQRSRVRSPARPDFLSSSGSGTGSTQPREPCEVNWGATWTKKVAAPGLENRD